MKKLAFIGLPLVLVGLAAAAWFEPTHSVRGWLRGELFFQGRSASWWEASLVGGDPEMIAQLPEKLEAAKGDAVPLLIKLLESDRIAVRWNAAAILGKIGPPAAPATDALLRSLDDPSPYVRHTAIQALAAIKPDRPEVVAALIKKLSTEDRDHVIRPLSVFRAKAGAAVPTLLDLAGDKSLPIKTRWESIRTLGKIGPDARPAVPLLLELLKEKEDRLRDHSAESLGEIGDPVAVGPLTAALGDKSLKFRHHAVRSLGQLGAAAKSAIPAIEPLLQDKDEQVREEAKIALRRIDPERK